MRHACQYAIIRFLPFIETGEFANVGVVLLCPAQRYFGFRLLKHYARLTHFFENMEARVYTESRKLFNEELARIHEMLKSGPFYEGRRQVDIPTAQALFAELVRPREVIMRFDAPRAVLADDPTTKLEELFGFYVERDFVTKQYQERLLEKNIRQFLSSVDLGRQFTEQRLGSEDYSVLFHFVQCDNAQPVKVIKPFYLAQDEPGKILEHGGPWVDRIRRLKRRKFLPEKVLFAVQGPGQAQQRKYAAYQEICGDLEEQGILLAPAADRERIIEFASQ